MVRLRNDKACELLDGGWFALAGPFAACGDLLLESITECGWTEALADIPEECHDAGREGSGVVCIRRSDEESWNSRFLCARFSACSTVMLSGRVHHEYSVMTPAGYARFFLAGAESTATTVAGGAQAGPKSLPARLQQFSVKNSMS